MAMVIFIVGLMTGCFLNIVINKISWIVDNRDSPEKCINFMDSKKLKKYTKLKSGNIIVILISGLLFLISLLQIGLNVIFIKALVLDSILIVVSFTWYFKQYKRRY